MPINGKYKVLVLSDHALSTSGVGTQTRHLINGLLKKNIWSFRQFGAALKHTDYRTVVVNDDFIIKPIDGFGTPELLRVTLATEKPDLLFIFTDPRFFTWLFEIEDEIHQMCPIVWWHVWDNYPFPRFNDSFYYATDKINCHSHMTYTMLKEDGKFKNKTNFIPHAIPDDMYHALPDEKILEHKKNILKNRDDHFVGIWVNRNAKRKRPNDVLQSWKMFLDLLEKEYGHRKATLIMHTEPTDNEGPNLYATCDMLGITNNVFFSRDRIDFNQMNILYNISDFCLNVSYAEGFGLSTLESMMTGTPIVAAKTGGLTRQVVNHRDGTENGVALDVELKSLVGSQSVPYIYEDYVSNQSIAKGIKKLYDKNLDNQYKVRLKEKVKNYAKSEFSYQDTIDKWNKSMISAINEFKNRIQWTNTEL
jgi:glycosyltransferase involved in cell wall biosynthesis